MKISCRTSNRVRAVLLILFGLLSTTDSRAADSPHYRGPAQNGIFQEVIRTNWGQTAPKLLWKVNLDPGLSSFSVAQGKLFSQVNRRVGGNDREVCIALSAENGRELWDVSLDIADYPHGGVGNDDGPRSTPVVDGDRVFVFTSYLRLFCLNISNGAVVWQKDFVSEFGSPVAAWQNAASPLIIGDSIFINANTPGGCLAAVRKSDGTILWRKNSNDEMTQSMPVYTVIGGRAQVIFFAQSGLVSLDPDSGNTLWRYELPFSTSTAASPVVADDIVYASAAYGVGSAAVRVSSTAQGASRTQLWRKAGANMNHWATPVPFQGFLYGPFGQSAVSLRCIDAATGTERWRQPGLGYGSTLLVNNLLLVLNDRGDIYLVQPDPDAYREIATFKAVNGKCWNVPTVANGKIYVRSTTQAAAYDVSPPVVIRAPLKLSGNLSKENNLFQLQITSSDGSLIEPSRHDKIDIFQNSVEEGIAAGWIKLNQPLLATNGLFHLNDSLNQNSVIRVYKAEERP